MRRRRVAINSQGNVNLRLLFAQSIFRLVYENFALSFVRVRRETTESFSQMSFHVANLKICSAVGIKRAVVSLVAGPGRKIRETLLLASNENKKREREKRGIDIE